MFKTGIEGFITKFKKLSTDIEKFVAVTVPKIAKARELAASMESNVDVALKLKAKIDEVLG